MELELPSPIKEPTGMAPANTYGFHMIPIIDSEDPQRWTYYVAGFWHIRLQLRNEEDHASKKLVPFKFLRFKDGEPAGNPESHHYEIGEKNRTLNMGSKHLVEVLALPKFPALKAEEQGGGILSMVGAVVSSFFSADDSTPPAPEKAAPKKLSKKQKAKMLRKANETARQAAVQYVFNGGPRDAEKLCTWNQPLLNRLTNMFLSRALYFDSLYALENPPATSRGASCISDEALVKLMKRWLVDLFRSSSSDELQISKALFIASLCTDPKRLPTAKNFSSSAGGDDEDDDDEDEDEDEQKDEAFSEQILQLLVRSVSQDYIRNILEVCPDETRNRLRGGIEQLIKYVQHSKPEFVMELHGPLIDHLRIFTSATPYSGGYKAAVTGSSGWSPFGSSSSAVSSSAIPKISSQKFLTKLSSTKVGSESHFNNLIALAPSIECLVVLGQKSEEYARESELLEKRLESSLLSSSENLTSWMKHLVELKNVPDIAPRTAEKRSVSVPPAASIVAVISKPKEKESDASAAVEPPSAIEKELADSPKLDGGEKEAEEKVVLVPPRWKLHCLKAISSNFISACQRNSRPPFFVDITTLVQFILDVAPDSLISLVVLRQLLPLLSRSKVTPIDTVLLFDAFSHRFPPPGPDGELAIEQKELYDLIVGWLKENFCYSAYGSGASSSSQQVLVNIVDVWTQMYKKQPNLMPSLEPVLKEAFKNVPNLTILSNSDLLLTPSRAPLEMVQIFSARALEAAAEMAKQNRGEEVVKEVLKSKFSPLGPVVAAWDYQQSFLAHILFVTLENSIVHLNCALETLGQPEGAFVVHVCDYFQPWMAERAKRAMETPATGRLAEYRTACMKLLDPWLVEIGRTAKSVVSLDARLCVLQWINGHRALFTHLLNRSYCGVTMAKIDEVIARAQQRVAQLEQFTAFCLMCAGLQVVDLAPLRTALEALQTEWLNLTLSAALSADNVALEKDYLQPLLVQHRIASYALLQPLSASNLFNMLLRELRDALPPAEKDALTAKLFVDNVFTPALQKLHAYSQLRSDFWSGKMPLNTVCTVFDIRGDVQRAVNREIDLLASALQPSDTEQEQSVKAEKHNSVLLIRKLVDQFNILAKFLLFLTNLQAVLNTEKEVDSLKSFYARIATPEDTFNMSLPLDQVEPLTVQFDRLMRTASMRRNNSASGRDDEWKQIILLLSTPDGKALIDFLKEKRDDGLYDHLIETNISSSEESNLLVTTIADFKDALELLQPFLLRCATHKTLEAFLNDFYSLRLTPAAVEKLRGTLLTLPTMKTLIENITVDTELRGERLLDDIIAHGRYIVSAESIRLENPSKTLTELEQLRYQLMLATKRSARRDRELQKESNRKEFSRQLNIVKQIGNLLAELLQIGDFAVLREATREISFQPPLNVAHWEKCVHDLSTQLATWKKATQDFRRRYPYLNFFTAADLKLLLSMLVSNANGLEEFIRLKLFLRIGSVLHLKTSVAEFKRRSAIALPTSVDKLEALGRFLHDIMNRCGKDGGEAEVEPPRPNPPQFKSQFQTGFAPDSAPSFILTADVISCVTTLYANRGHPPEAYEVLFCNSDTSFEEVQALLLRCRYVTKHNARVISKPLYSLVNFQLLRTAVQMAVVVLLEREFLGGSGNGVISLTASTMSDAPNLLREYSLVFIGGEGSDRSELQSVLQDKYSKKFQMLTAAELEAVYAGWLGDHVQVYTSARAGVGKSHTITRRITQELKLGYRKVALHGAVSDSQFISAFTKGASDLSVGIHALIASSCSTSVNFQLYQILVMGRLSSEDRVVVRGNHHYFLELSSGLSDYQPLRHIFFCQHLRKLLITADPLSPQNPLDINDKDLTTLCSVLHTFQLHPNHFDRAPSLQFSYPTPLTREQCVAALQRALVIGSQGRRANFAAESMVTLMNFVRLLYESVSVLQVAGFYKLDFWDEPQKCTWLRKQLLEMFIWKASFLSERPVAADAKESNVVIAKDHLWEQDNQLMVVFPKPVNGNMEEAGACRFLYRNKALVPPQLQTIVTEQHGILADYASMQTAELQELLRDLFGTSQLPPTESQGKRYVLTLNNVLKMVAIWLRAEAKVPVILMGSTGCGKTALVKFLCQHLLMLPPDALGVLLVHGGVTQPHIIAFMQEQIARAKNNMVQWVFFDEVNACEEVSLFSEILCDRTLLGEAIPPNMIVLAACNPYQLRQDNREKVGLAYDYQRGTSSAQQQQQQQTDMSNLLYRVYPLTASMTDFVLDFGSLSDRDEEEYIDAILARENIGALYRKDLVSLLSFSHKHIRALYVADPAAAVSLRDVERFVRVHAWLVKNGTALLRPSHPIPPQELFMCALFIVYVCRFDDRLKFWEGYMAHWRTLNNFRQPAGSPLTILNEIQQLFMKRLKLPQHVARNTALSENTFVMAVAIFTRTPLMLVGKPGSSKSLSIQLILDNFRRLLNDSRAAKDNIDLPSLEAFPYQCSPQSTPEGIRKTFDNALRYQQQRNQGKNLNNAQETISVVLLDEVGLAEFSPHLPLKVLHELLEDPKVAIIGISNWSLDPAKMNRAIYLRRPLPDVQDLTRTAMAIVVESNVPELKTALPALAKVYSEIYHRPENADFFGLRDFYYLVKMVQSQLMLGRTLREALHRSVARNFGGHSNSEAIAALLCRVSGEVAGGGFGSDSIRTETVLDLIQQNLRDPHSRHLMVISDDKAALQILLQEGVISVNNSEIIFGSNFPRDMSEEVTLENINRIKACMEIGRPVVLLHQEALYESLYDLLNQSYTSFGNKNFCRIAVGPQSSKCEVHPDFKLILVVESEDIVAKRIPAALLNRLEKQRLGYADILTKTEVAAMHSVRKWVSDVAAHVPKLRLHHLLPGLQLESIGAVALALRREIPAEASTIELVTAGIKRMLLQVMIPERAVQLRLDPRCQGAYESEQALWESYFSSANNSLRQYLTQCVKSGQATRATILTHTPPTTPLDTIIRSVYPNFRKLDPLALQREQDFRRGVIEFLESPTEDLLMVQLYLKEVSTRLLQHARYIVLHEANARNSSKPVLYLLHLRPRSDLQIPYDPSFPPILIPDLEDDALLPDASSSTASLFDQLPPLLSMCEPLEKLVRDRRIDVGKLLAGNFRQVLSGIEYRVVDRIEVGMQIEALRYLLTEDVNTLGIIEERVRQLILEGGVHLDVNWYLEVAREADGWSITTAGSFRRALAHRLQQSLDTALANVLTSLDRNYDLIALNAIRSKSPDNEFYTRVILDSDLIAVHQQLQLQQRDRHFPFAARMPFSFALFRRFDDLWELIGGTNPSEKMFNDVCQTSTKRVSFDVLSNPALLHCYLHDFIAMKIIDPHPKRGELADLVHEMVFTWLNSTTESPITSLPQIHYRFASCEAKIRAVVALLHSHPPFAPILHAHVKNAMPWNAILCASLYELFRSASASPVDLLAIVSHQPLFDEIVEQTADAPLLAQWRGVQLAGTAVRFVPRAPPPLLESLLDLNTSCQAMAELLKLVTAVDEGVDALQVEGAKRFLGHALLLFDVFPSCEDDSLASQKLYMMCASEKRCPPYARLLAIRILLDRFGSHCYKLLAQLLQEEVTCNGHFDTPDGALILLAFLTCQTQSDPLSVLSSALSRPSAPPVEHILALAVGRSVVRAAAELYLQGMSTLSTERLDFVQRVSQLLSGDLNAAGAQLRVFFLRVIERQRGKCFVESLATLSAKDRLSFFERFSAGELSDRSDAFVPLFGESYTQTRLALADSSALAPLASEQGEKFRSHLLLALFSEVNEEGGLGAERLAALSGFLSQSNIAQSLHISDAEVRLSHQILSKQFTLHAEYPHELRVPLSHLILHLLSAARQQSFWHWLMHSPAEWASRFVPSSPQDVSAAVLGAIGDGTALFECIVCGNRYFVGECGQPMVVAKCLCGNQIGGVDHNPVANTRVTAKPAAAIPPPTGYDSRSASLLADRFLAFRNVTPLGYRVCRLLLNSALLSGLLLHEPFAALESFVKLTTLQFVTHARDHLVQDWAILCELTKRNTDEVCIALHRVIEVMCGIVTDSRTAGSEAWRTEFENAIGRCADEVFSNLDAILRDHRAASSTVPGALLHQVLELEAPKDPSVRQQQLPLLTSARSIPSLSSNILLESFYTTASNRIAYPLIELYFSKRTEMEKLSMLPALVELEHLVLQYFSRRLTRAEAESLTFEEAIARLPQEAQLSFTRALRAVEKVFEALSETELAHPFGLCDRSKPPAISSQSKLIICCTTTTKSFPYLHAMKTYLATLQNDFLSAIPQQSSQLVMMTSSQAVDRFSMHCELAAGTHVIQPLSSLFRNHWAAVCQIDTPQLSRQCGVRIDWESVQWLLVRQLIDKPFLEVRSRLFDFVDEGVVATGQLRQLLSRKIDQADLPKSVQDAIVLALQNNPSIVPSMLSDVKMCMKFLQRSGGDGQSYLSRYMEEILHYREVAARWPSVIHDRVQLMHVASLYRLLQEVLEHDHLNHLPKEVFVPISEAARATLQTVLNSKKIQVATILQLLGALLEQLPQFKHFDDPLAEWLEQVSGLHAIDTEKCALELLPNTLKLCHTVEVYRFFLRCKQDA